MRGSVDALAGAHQQARGLLERAEHAGMEVSQAQFELNGATDALVKARAAVHTGSPDGVRTEAEPGLAIADRARARGLRALDELRFRRRGLAVSVVVIVALIGGLVLKIRQLEHGPPRPGGEEHHG
jgi:hypothetical protein